MESKIETLKDVTIKTLGASITSTEGDQSKTRYSFIELLDGRIFTNVEISHALQGRLDQSFSDETPVELHMVSTDDPNLPHGILAVRGDDGRLFAQNIPELPIAIRYLPLSPIKIAKELRTYVRSLPNAILI